MTITIAVKYIIAVFAASVALLYATGLPESPWGVSYQHVRLPWALLGVLATAIGGLLVHSIAHLLAGCGMALFGNRSAEFVLGTHALRYETGRGLSFGPGRRRGPVLIGPFLASLFVNGALFAWVVHLGRGSTGVFVVDAAVFYAQIALAVQLVGVILGVLVLGKEQGMLQRWRMLD